MVCIAFSPSLLSAASSWLNWNVCSSIILY